MTADQVPSPLARVRRRPERARYDTEAVRALLDAAPFCHVATVRDGRPVVLPMVTATLLDGLVLARSATNHSMNYRSVTVHGHAVEVTDGEEVIAAMRALVEHLVPGRWQEVRKPTIAELRMTTLWRVEIEDASVKARSGPSVEPEDDITLPVWAGVVPTCLAFGRPVPAEGMPPAAPGTVAVNAGLARPPSD